MNIQPLFTISITVENMYYNYIRNITITLYYHVAERLVVVGFAWHSGWS